MTVALYCRVSTDEQAQQGFSIDNQKERLEAFSLSQGWSDYRFYIDDGSSGTSMDRPALRRLIQHIEKKQIETVVVYKLDRLGRRQKDVLFLLEDVFEKSNVAFKSATEPFDTATPLGKAMIGILAVFAQLERDTIIERLSSGRRQRILKGKWYGGRVPFGYRWDTKTQKLEVIPEQAELVKKAYSLYLQGHSRLYIAEWLSSRSKDRVFDHAVVRDLLQRPIYTGRLNNVGELVSGDHEAIIDIETFERVQNEVKTRREGRAPIGDYLLSGLLRCGLCGGPVIHVWANKRRYQYYACRAQHVRAKDANNDCSLGYIPKIKLEQWIVQKLKALSLDLESVQQELTTQNTGSTRDEEMIASLQKQLESIEEKLERWFDAFEQGLLNPGQLKNRIDALEEEKKAITFRLDELDDEPKEDRTDDVLGTLQRIGEAWDFMTFEEQKVVLRAALDHVILYPGRDPELVWNV